MTAPQIRFQPGSIVATLGAMEIAPNEQIHELLNVWLTNSRGTRRRGVRLTAPALPPRPRTNRPSHRLEAVRGHSIGRRHYHCEA